MSGATGYGKQPKPEQTLVPMPIGMGQHMSPAAQSSAVRQSRPNMHIDSATHEVVPPPPALRIPQHTSPAAQSSGPSHAAATPMQSAGAEQAIVVEPPPPNMMQQI